MSETKTPRAHAELAIKFYSDSKMKCWYWHTDSQTWFDAVKPRWHESGIYEVSEQKPAHTPKKRVTLAGIEFNAPESVEPAPSTCYWFPYTVAVSVKTFACTWKGSELDRHLLERGLIHLEKEDAELHAEALIKLNKGLKWQCTPIT